MGSVASSAIEGQPRTHAVCNDDGGLGVAAHHVLERMSEVGKVVVALLQHRWRQPPIILQRNVLSTLGYLMASGGDSREGEAAETYRSGLDVGWIVAKLLGKQLDDIAKDGAQISSNLTWFEFRDRLHNPRNQSTIPSNICTMLD
mgnify:FL=1